MRQGAHACGVEIHQIPVTKDMLLLRNYLICGYSMWTYTCVLEQKCKTSEKKKEKRSERGGPIRTMCLGQCHASRGCQEGAMAARLCKPALGSVFQSGREVTKNYSVRSSDGRGRMAWHGFGLGDVEINFYIPSCFIVPFTGEQVQSYLRLPLLLESHKKEVHKQSV